MNGRDKLFFFILTYSFSSLKAKNATNKFNCFCYKSSKSLVRFCWVWQKKKKKKKKSLQKYPLYLFVSHFFPKWIVYANYQHLFKTLHWGTGIQGAYVKFPDFFHVAFKIVVDSWKFTILLLYILRDDWPIFMISDSNEQLQQQLEYTLLKPDFHSWWISKMQSDILEERYAIKFCFKLGKKYHRNAWNASDCFWSILHESSISFWVA